MSVDTILFNAKVYTSQGIIEGGIAIDEGRIARISKATTLPRASSRLNMNGNLILPGLIDSHVHLRDQKLAYREDFISGTSAAAAGGVTSVIDMPNNKPVTMNSNMLRERIELAKKRILVNVGFNSALPERTEEVQLIVKEGAVGFKLYLIKQIGGVNIDDENALKSAFGAIAETKVPITVHAEDKTILEGAKKYVQNIRRSYVKTFQEIHPPAAEVEAIKRVTELAQKSGARIHICHVSSEAGLKTIQKIKRTKINITCEVTPHHLLLTSKYFKENNKLALTLPPLRTKADNKALWEGLRQGLIENIASDHAPHSKEEKMEQSTWNVKPGIAGLETMLPLMLTEVNKRHLEITDLVRLTSKNPAKIFNIKDRGSLEEGYFADIVVIDIDREHTIDASQFKSKAKFSPFNGWKVKGKPVKTFVNGQLVMDEGEIVAKSGIGWIIR